MDGGEPLSRAWRRAYDAAFLLFLLTVIGRRVALGSELALEGKIVVFQGVLVLILTAIHALARTGPRRALALFLVAAGFSLVAEWLGATKGWIFGSYDYSDVLGVRLFGEVPLLIPAAWYVLAYLADALATLSLPPTASKLLKLLYAALVLTAWDFLFDPICVTIGGWTWEGGGAYFGHIPISNFVGWFGVSLAIFAAYGRGKDESERETRMARSDPWRYGAPILMYGAITGLMAFFAIQLGRVGEAVVGILVAAPVLLLAANGYVRTLGQRATAATT